MCVHQSESTYENIPPKLPPFFNVFFYLCLILKIPLLELPLTPLGAMLIYLFGHTCSEGILIYIQNFVLIFMQMKLHTRRRH